ncbi:hypothetical protein JR316_0000112 [Psilocybe cubensis]|uniref:Uncharacterized protein n=2 Tax=Psilocybe cubensis TaxID=181762 RepID=A0ACB8HDG0_PSICU|nr:hypothetical protein JR316_0000112 [Psilocybe cubensis]KAH9486048.1 hypothetical protein JR316_0000112 [Psilocybe cubensis]
MLHKQAHSLIFRNFLTTDYTSTKATAFTPDIIPQFGNTVDPALLIDEYDQFIGLPVQPSERNNIYVRGKTTSNVVPGSKTAIVLRAVPSELILWPQAWNKVTPTGPGPLVIDSSIPNKVVTLSTPFQFSPSNLCGFNFALIATQTPLPETKRNTRLRDTLPPPPPDAKNWRELVNFFNTDTSTVYYNVVVADPNAPVISVSTRLRVVDNGSDPLNFRITIETSIMPEGTFVSLSSSTGLISLQKTRLADDIGVRVKLAPGFDDIITLCIFPDPKGIIETFAWVSLQASIIPPQTVNSGATPISKVVLLGALNIIFHDDAATNLKHASPAANQLKKLVETVNMGERSEVPHAQAGTITSQSTNVTGAANGWWFRDAIGDHNLFPRTASLCHSPDIQPVGITPRSDSQQILGGSNANTDWTDANRVVIQQGAPNYIYVRGNCTLGSDYPVQMRLFCVPSALLLYPPMYSQFSVTDADDHSNPFVAIRNITSTSYNSFNVVDTAFDLLNPQRPPSGSDHYCLIAETRSPTTENPDPDWPHEDTGSFSSGAGFNTWIGSTPTVCWRNVGYKTGGAQVICSTNVTIPAGLYSSSTQWTLEVDADNAPVGSAWSLTGNGPSIPGVNIGFAQTTITAPNMVEGCHFTGLPATGYSFSVVLQWFSNGKTPGNNMKFSFLLYTTQRTTSANGKLMKTTTARTHRQEAADWPFTVGIHHPGVEDKGDGNKKHIGYLGHRFKKVGRNPWPHAKVDKVTKLKSVSPVPVYAIGSDHWNVKF